MEEENQVQEYSRISTPISFLDKRIETVFPPPKRSPDMRIQWFYVKGSSVLIREDRTELQDFPELNLTKIFTTYLGIQGNIMYYLGSLSLDTEPPEGRVFVYLRDLFDILSEEMVANAAYAVQVSKFISDHQYCGSCGARTKDSLVERARICTSCDLVVYPKICPAVIVLVTRGDEVLLARSPNFRPDMYSIIAGFVEAGETIESAVAREVKEECGISIKNIRYFASQPWPFPHSLMIGFTAEYENGEIVVDNREIVEAKWFSRNSLPELPGLHSIAGIMIELFKDGYHISP